MRQPKCGKCGSIRIEEVDGSKLDGMPGIKYQYCAGCGWSRPITRRAPRVRLCNHKWEEQPGEPARDVCTACGEVRY